MKKKVVSVLLSSVMVMSVFAGVATQVSADEKPVVKFVFTKGGFEGAPENDVIPKENRGYLQYYFGSCCSYWQPCRTGKSDFVW